MNMKKFKYGFDHTTGDGQKRLMAISVGMDSETYIGKVIDLNKPGDHGCNPIGDGTFKMVPTGEIVSLEEMRKRLHK